MKDEEKKMYCERYNDCVFYRILNEQGEVYGISYPAAIAVFTVGLIIGIYLGMP